MNHRQLIIIGSIWHTLSTVHESPMVTSASKFVLGGERTLIDLKAHTGLNDSLLISMISVQVASDTRATALAVAVYSLCSIPPVDTSAHDHLELGLSDRQLQ